MTIRNPLEWGVDQFRLAAHAVGSASHSVHRPSEDPRALAAAIRRIGTADLWAALRAGFADFTAFRSDVIFLCILYPVAGLVLEQLAVRTGMIPLLFPLASGFALVGPFAAVGLYEMSRRREEGGATGWADALGVFRAPSFGAIAILGMVLIALFAIWLQLANELYMQTLGPLPPVSLRALLHDALTTGPGLAMVAIGVGVGFVFACVAMAISVVAFPLLLDRPVGFDTAVWTSIRAVMASPGPMALWGLIVAGALVLGSLPLFLGLVVVLPVLGHATWHLYRRLLPG